MSDYRVEYVTLSGGKLVPAEKLICPVCKVLDMDGRFNTSVDPAEAECSKGHEWTFTTKADA
jgi:hypothetical protein